MICLDCPHGPSTITRARCCSDRARERDKYERAQHERIYSIERLLEPRKQNRAARRRAAADRRKKG